MKVRTFAERLAPAELDAPDNILIRSGFLWASAYLAKPNLPESIDVRLFWHSQEHWIQFLHQHYRPLEAIQSNEEADEWDFNRQQVAGTFPVVLLTDLKLAVTHCSKHLFD